MWFTSIILLNLSTIFVIVLSDCNVNITNGLAVKTPVFITAAGKLLSPDGPVLKWRAGEESNLLCSGSSNRLTINNEQETTLKCLLNGKFTINTTNVDISTLACKQSNKATVINTNKDCLNGGTLHEIGFQTLKNGFVKYIDTCYNLNNASVVYTYHIISGKSINDSIADSNRPAFSSFMIPKTVKPDSSYKRVSQEKRFTTLFGTEMVTKYLSKNSFLARGHLVPDSDGIFRSWQSATYFYMNVAPQWQKINGQNWVRVENFARKKAALLNDDLEIYTGNYGILTLPNKNGDEIELTLEDNGKVIVPKYYWKILKYKNSCIAFVTLNNPFATNEEDLCTDICTKYDWPNKDFDLYPKGKTNCCTVPDLIKTMNGVIPIREADCINVLSL